MLQRVYPYACLSIDCTWAEWFRAMKRAIYTSETSNQLKPKISRLFSAEGNVIITLCVRSAFDLYLQALNLPTGTEIIMSAINIPEMVRIVRKYGYIPVPVDIDIDTLQTTPERVEAAITKKTGLIIIAETYGTRYSLAEISKVAKKHNIPLFEDCAEGFCGRNFNGDPHADITVFSFGPIKTATAFQGAIMIIRNNPQLLSQIKRIHQSYPVQSTKTYCKKVLKYSAGLIYLNWEGLNHVLRPPLMKIGFDYKKRVVGLMRGFPPGKGLEVYRYQPCAAMLSFMYRRLAMFNAEKFFKLNRGIQEGTDILTAGGVTVPGYAQRDRTYWLYPIIADETLKAYKDLNKAGIDAYKGISQLNCVEAPIGDSYAQPKNAIDMFEKLVYLPLHKEVPLKDIKKICKKTVELLNPKPKL